MQAITKVLVVLIVLFACYSRYFGQQKTFQKCTVPPEIGGKYSLVNEARLLGKEGRISLDVVVKEKNFTKDYLTELARRIKSQYCNENYIGVAIFDNKKAAIGWHYDFVVSSGKVDRRRGVYIWDGEKGEEGLDFSTKRGNPLDEVKVDLSKSIKK